MYISYNSILLSQFCLFPALPLQTSFAKIRITSDACHSGLCPGADRMPRGSDNTSRFHF